MCMEYNKHKDFFNKAYKTGSDVWTNIRIQLKGAQFMEKLPPGASVLDIGSGRGVFANELAAAGFTVTGIDFEEEIVTKANMEIKVAGLSPKVNFIVADAFNMPFADNSFDGVCAVGFLENIYSEDWKRYSDEVTRVLKPGGVYLDISLSRKAKVYTGVSPINSANGEFDIGDVHYHFFEKEEMRDIFAGKLNLIYQEVKFIEKPRETALLESLFQK